MAYLPAFTARPTASGGAERFVVLACHPVDPTPRPARIVASTSGSFAAFGSCQLVPRVARSLGRMLAFSRPQPSSGRPSVSFDPRGPKRLGRVYEKPLRYPHCFCPALRRRVPGRVSSPDRDCPGACDFDRSHARAPAHERDTRPKPHARTDRDSTAEPDPVTESAARRLGRDEDELLRHCRTHDDRALGRHGAVGRLE